VPAVGCGRARCDHSWVLPSPAWLFCPGDRPDRFAKAAAAADAVIVDLEDAVPPEHKDAARENLYRACSEVDPDRLVVRVNGTRSRWFADDASAVVAAGIRTVMLPKAADPAELASLADLSVVALCETAAGVQAAARIAEAGNCVALFWGAEDLVADFGGSSCRDPAGRYWPAIEHVRASVLVAARAAGKAALDAVHPDFSDAAGLGAEARTAAALGFHATVCIHPSQVPVVREAYRPTDAEIAHALAVLGAAQDATATGARAVDGRMVDLPMLTQARAVLARAGRDR
jgi:citrate lyase subunit beta/citryl-CoA lyase